MSGTVGPRIPPFTNTYSLDFDGMDDYVDCGSASYLNGLTEFSVSISFLILQSFLILHYCNV